MICFFQKRESDMANRGKLGRMLLIGGFFLASTAGLSAQTSSGTTSGVGSGSGIGTGSKVGSTSGVGTSSGMGATGGLGSGASTTTGASFSGAMGGTGRGTTAGANLPAASNTFKTFYSNPMATAFTSGISGTNMAPTTKAFGQPMYSIATGTTVANSAALGNTSSAEGFTTVGIRRAPSYTTALGADMPLVKHAPVQVRAELVRSLETSPFFKDKNIQVAVDGGLVILQGQVANDRERRIAEGVVRLTPGVRDVRNELNVPPPPASADE
ncbi:MAG: BON domain-containing protein [Planctomycetes bacterium]|nr:BON domain-containing protein [Planctomycetota bacterium]